MSFKAIHRLIILATFVLTTSISVARGGEVLSHGSSKDSLFKISFRFDSSVIDPEYSDNRRVFDQLDHTLKSLNGRDVDSIVIITQASPEGVLEHNNALARRRGNSMRRHMRENYPELIPLLRVYAEGESWRQLRQFVLNDTIISNEERSRVLRILDNETISDDTRKWRLERDTKYDYIYKTYYPILRNSAVYLIYVDGELVKPMSLDTPPAPTMMLRPTALASLNGATRVEEQTPEQIIKPTEPTTKRDTLLFALKSNMLYDALTVLNAELEVPISRHFSVAVEYLFPWWERGNKYCLQLLELGVEGRYWFRNNVNKVDRLGGHFLGVYGMSAMYDIQKDYNPAHQGEFWSAGLTYGYAMRVGKQKRISLEFSLSVGYLTTDYRNYFPADDYSELYIDKLGYGRLRYFGPTKLKVSLVVPFNIGYNKKGGSR